MKLFHRICAPTGSGRGLVSAAAYGAQESDPSTGFEKRRAVEGLVEAHDPSDGPALLGLVQFANFPAMAAYNAAAAQRVMASFDRRLALAAGAKRAIARIGDDLYAIWFAGLDVQSAEGELKSIAYVLADEIEDVDLTVAPDIHVGSARTSRETESFLGLISKAQISLTPLKRLAQMTRHQGVPAGRESAADRFALEQALRRAVRDEQLSLRYQPFIDAQAGCVAGAEVLLRWRHPDLGDVSPAKFVPLLEETGLIHDIGLWTFNSACRQLRNWRSAGWSDIRLAINLSAVQLQNPTLRAQFERTVQAHCLSPSDVELELTETAAMEDRPRTVALFHELRALGFGVAIDDFGSGHSNLSYLKSLPFTKLKIDREFVADIDRHASSQAICKALVELGAGLGISVLAEGVERVEEVAMLRRLGCHVFQGFLFARPLTAEDLTAKLHDPAWRTQIAASANADWRMAS